MPPAIIPFIPAIIGAGASVAGSFLGGQPKTTTQTSTPTFSPQLQNTMNQLLNYSQSSIANPEANFQPIRQAGYQQINQAYGAVPQEVTQALSRRGYGSSGAMGNSLYKTGLARAGAISGFEGNLAQEGINQQNRGASLGEQLLQLGRGTTGTGTSPDMSASNALMTGGNALSNVTLLTMLNKYLNPGGGGGGNVASNPGGYNYPGG